MGVCVLPDAQIEPQCVTVPNVLSDCERIVYVICGVFFQYILMLGRSGHYNQPEVGQRLCCGGCKGNGADMSDCGYCGIGIDAGAIGPDRYQSETPGGIVYVPFGFGVCCTAGVEEAFQAYRDSLSRSRNGHRYAVVAILLGHAVIGNALPSLLIGLLQH